MIKVKNSQLTNEVILMLNNLMNLDIKAGASFKLMRIIKDLSTIIEDKLKAEKLIINKWAMKDENGDYIPVIGDDGAIIPGTIKINDMVKFEQEMSELLNIESTILHNRINFEELGLTETLKIKDLLKIEFIFE